MKAVNLGSGPHLKLGFINIDIFPKNQNAVDPDNLYVEWDLTKGLPPSIGNDIDVVCSEHMLEHVTAAEAYSLLKDCFNRMKSGGEIKICVPDFYKLAKAYIDEDYDHFQPIRYSSPNNNLMEFVTYSLFGEGHKFMYDINSLCDLLDSVGFLSAPDDFDPKYFSAERRQFSCYARGFKP